MNESLTGRGSVDQRAERTQQNRSVPLQSRCTSWVVPQTDFQDSNPEWPCTSEPQFSICKAVRVIPAQSIVRSIQDEVC